MSSHSILCRVDEYFASFSGPHSNQQNNALIRSLHIYSQRCEKYNLVCSIHLLEHCYNLIYELYFTQQFKVVQQYFNFYLVYALKFMFYEKHQSRNDNNQLYQILIEKVFHCILMLTKASVYMVSKCMEGFVWVGSFHNGLIIRSCYYPFSVIYGKLQTPSQIISP